MEKDGIGLVVGFAIRRAIQYNIGFPPSLR